MNRYTANTELKINVGDRFVCKFRGVPVVFEVRNINISDNTVNLQGVYLDVFGDENEKEVGENEFNMTIETACNNETYWLICAALDGVIGE